MFGSAYRIATVWGIPIRLHVSLLIVAAIWILDFGLVAGLVVGTGVLASIVLHELGHSLAALAKGCRVRGITLMFMGGAASLDRMPARPLDEFLVAAAGPAVSLALGLAGIAAGACFPGMPRVPGFRLNYLQFLGAVNVTLMVFNLLPAFPMDGGRIFRALLVPRMGRLRATFVAARLGKIIAVLLGLYGWRTGNWSFVAIAFFVYIAAGAEHRAVQHAEARRAMGLDPWAAFGPPDEPDEYGDGQVWVSPPPYRRGPGSAADIEPEDRNDPFRNIFGQ